jgi:hypothetical protein
MARIWTPAHSRLLVIAVALGFTGSSVFGTDGVPPPLRDQYGREGTPFADREPRVVIVVDARRLRRIKAWERALVTEFGEGLAVVRVADVPRSAPTQFEKVAAKLRRRVPEDVRVLVDLDGAWALAYELDTRQPNLLVFTGDGALAARHAGFYAESLFARVRADLERAGVVPLNPRTPVETR